MIFPVLSLREGRGVSIMYRMKPLPYLNISVAQIDPDCALCDDSGFDHAEDNFCPCPEGDKLLSNEMATAETFEHDLD